MSAYLAKDRLLKSVLKKLIQISGNYSSLKKHFLKIFFKKSFLFDQNVESDWWRWETLHFLPLCLIIIFLFDTRASPFLFVDRRPIRFSNEKTAPAEAHRSAGRFDWRGRVFRSRTAFFIFSLFFCFFLFRRQIVSAVHGRWGVEPTMKGGMERSDWSKTGHVTLPLNN